MSVLWLSAIILAIAIVGYVLGRQRAMASADGDAQLLHSLPVYYGSNALMKCIVPAFGVMVLWMLVQPLFIDNRIVQMIPESEIAEGATQGLVMSEVRRTAEGLDNAVALGLLDEATARDAGADVTDLTQRLKDAGQVVTGSISQPILNAAQAYRDMTGTSGMLMTVAVLLVALLGAGWGVMESRRDFRARNVVEKAFSPF